MEEPWFIASVEFIEGLLDRDTNDCHDKVEATDGDAIDGDVVDLGVGECENGDGLDSKKLHCKSSLSIPLFIKHKPKRPLCFQQGSRWC
jgi:hypothetical protein